MNKLLELPPRSCPYGSRRYTSNGPARCAGGHTAARCLCYPTWRTRLRMAIVTWWRR